MNKRPGYSPEVRERAVRLVLTSEHEPTCLLQAGCTVHVSPL